MKHQQSYFLSLLLIVLLFNQCVQPREKTAESLAGIPLQDFFSFKEDGPVIISGHRGAWRNSTYPDNSFEGLKYAVAQVPDIFFEVDPRLTKDSVIVLMHDATLDRTTNAVGRLADYTFEELDTVRLKDDFGNITDYKIPTLAEVIQWSIGKTVLNLDRKDVPPGMIVDLIRECEAEGHVMLTVHTGDQARFYHDQLPEAMLSVRIRNETEYEEFAAAGVPWENMIAYVGQTIDEKNQALVDKIHQHGVRVMIALSPTHDKLESAGERAVKYEEELLKSPDIIETDFPVELWEVIEKR